MYVLDRHFRVEIEKIKGSRFIGDCFVVRSAEEADERLSEVQSEFPDASHHCFAWRLGPDQFRYSDDGEPSGSAGKPMDAALRGRELINALVVVTRYFGGTKLGVGGLVRGYGAAAAAVLDAAGMQKYIATNRVEISCSFADHGVIKSVLRAFDLTPVEERFESGVTVVVELEVERTAALEREVVDRTAGRVQPTVAGRQNAPGDVV